MLIVVGTLGLRHSLYTAKATLIKFLLISWAISVSKNLIPLLLTSGHCLNWVNSMICSRNLFGELFVLLHHPVYFVTLRTPFGILEIPRCHLRQSVQCCAWRIKTPKVHFFASYRMRRRKLQPHTDWVWTTPSRSIFWQHFHTQSSLQPKLTKRFSSIFLLYAHATKMSSLAWLFVTSDY